MPLYNIIVSTTLFDMAGSYCSVVNVSPPPSATDGHCHAASTTSPPVCFIEIQLGMQTMAISWHQILKEILPQSLCLLIVPSHSTDPHGLQPTYDRYFLRV